MTAGTSLTTITITIGIACVIGYGLYKVISVKGSALTAIDYGRKWMAGMVFIGTLSNLPRFLQHFDADSFVKWMIVIVFFGAVAFVVGWIYGKFFGIK